MMVHEQIGMDERDSENFYDIGDFQLEESSCEDYDDHSDESTPVSIHNAVGNFDMSNVRDSMLKYSIIQKRWKNLYSEENSLRLQDAVKKFVFKKHYGDDGSLDINEMADDYDPLIY
jgi:hypothetical protein